jgi:hypothetical protein
MPDAVVENGRVEEHLHLAEIRDAVWNCRADPIYSAVLAHLEEKVAYFAGELLFLEKAACRQRRNDPIGHFMQIGFVHRIGLPDLDRA